jgi:hypothetical protein
MIRSGTVIAAQYRLLVEARNQRDVEERENPCV